MMVKRVSDKCAEIWSTTICIGDKVRMNVRTLESSEWIEGVVVDLKYRNEYLEIRDINGWRSGYLKVRVLDSITVKTDSDVKTVRYPMIETIKVIQYERK